jgi:hypothetical protein
MDYQLPVQTSGLQLLEEVTRSPLKSVEALHSIGEPPPHAQRVNVVRIIAAESACDIRADVVDIAPKLEVFVLEVGGLRETRSYTTRRSDFVPLNAPSKSLLEGTAAFSLVTRSHNVDFESSTGRVTSIAVQDVLVIDPRHGPPLFVACDDAIPGTLLVCHDWGHLPEPQLRVASVRRIG